MRPPQFRSVMTVLIKFWDYLPDIGEVWANMLHNVYAQLVAARGFSATAKTDPS